MPRGVGDRSGSGVAQQMQHTPGQETMSKAVSFGTHGRPNRSATYTTATVHFYKSDLANGTVLAVSRTSGCHLIPAEERDLAEASGALCIYDTPPELLASDRSRTNAQRPSIV